MWFRDDLRITDNEALAAAAAHGAILAVYILEDPSRTEVRPLGSASRWWLHHSLNALAKNLSEYDIPLLIARGDPRVLLPQILSETKANYVAWSRRYNQPQRSIDEKVKIRLREQGANVHSFAGHLLFEPWEISNSQGDAYKVFTPFSKKLKPLIEERIETYSTDTHDIYESLSGPGALLTRSQAGIDELDLLPASAKDHWTDGLHKAWDPGENPGLQRLNTFLESMSEKPHQQSYAAGRDIPSLSVTSRLSAHLRFGEISPQYVWQKVSISTLSHDDQHSFLNELMWRDFAWHRLYHQPDLATINVRREFDMFDWLWDPEQSDLSYLKNNLDPRKLPISTAFKQQRGLEEAQRFHELLQAWRSGMTGIPLVDAGMRELWETGHMHNRVRMVVASFLTKNLGIHWRHGEEWFWETLVDADAASNPFNWQWTAGSGDDASPYFRIFNPVTQAKRYDPDSFYISKWIPELSTTHYPEPIVDLKESRKAALEAYDEIKQVKQSSTRLLN